MFHLHTFSIKSLVAKIYIESYKLLSSKILKYKDVQKSELLDGIPDEVLSKMNYLEICPWDMVAKNCFLVEKEDGIHSELYPDKQGAADTGGYVVS